jgi:signal transduction histidine kinase
MNGGAETMSAEVWQERAARERRARHAAESIAEAGTRQLYEKQRQLELLHQIASVANAAASVEECIQRALNCFCDFTGWPVGHAYFVAADDSSRLQSSRLWHFGNAASFSDFRKVTEETEFLPGAGLPGRILQTGQAEWVVNLTVANFPRLAALGQTDVRSAFAFPVFVGTEIVAVLEFFSVVVQEPDQALLGIATQAGVQLGRVFERRRSQEIMKQFVAASRMAGMADIATAVLHNVGNVLNSVNVSASMISSNLRKSKCGQLAKGVQIMRKHQSELGPFFSTHPKGKFLLEFLEALAADLGNEQAVLASEADALQSNIDHIKQIVAAQQAYASVAGVREVLSAKALVEDALRLAAADLSRHQIEIIRDIQETPNLVTDRHKVLQILINLITNAKHAVDHRSEGRQIRLGVSADENGHICISVSDNGVGISEENMVRIFQHGFTTKKTGHGFGLHSGANAARELGGRLSAHSPGLGHGAVFILELPVEDQMINSEAA